ncbi:HD domain-containing protein [Nonomuraea sp. NPDC049152]|uniref:HD domain-containing protein n=1 Tax=Nonomuraea sp. NPDC049152 TaxID=3154350 RepID=UPI0034006DCD
MSIQPILAALPHELPPEQLRMVERAYTVAAFWHRDHRRRSGEPYIVHPVAVAMILAELDMDHELLCAALLHDVLEDSACTDTELLRDFDERIVALVRGLNALRHSADLEWCADERVLTLKLADRLHNQRTMEFLPRDKQRRKSRETLRAFAPAAARLGLEPIRQELEQLAGSVLSAPAEIRFTFHTVAIGATILPAEVRTRWLAEWLGELHALPGGCARLRFVVRLLWGMPRMAAVLRRPPLSVRDLLRPRVRVLLRCVRWLVRSDARVWTLLAPPLAWLVLDTAADRLGDAMVILITVPPVLAAGVRAVRARLEDRRYGE